VWASLAEARQLRAIQLGIRLRENVWEGCRIPHEARRSADQAGGDPQDEGLQDACRVILTHGQGTPFNAIPTEAEVLVIDQKRSS